MFSVVLTQNRPTAFGVAAAGAQSQLERHWSRRGSGDCRGAEEQQHAAVFDVSAVCEFGVVDVNVLVLMV